MVSNLYAFVSFLVGAGVATVVWFFVWRNNKKKFMKKLNEADVALAAMSRK